MQRLVISPGALFDSCASGRSSIQQLSCFCKHEPHARHRNDAICYRAKQSFIALSHEILPPPPPIPLESSEDTGKALALGDGLRYFASIGENWTQQPWSSPTLVHSRSTPKPN